MTHSLVITELVLRDAHQSLLATRMRLDDMLPIAAQLDRVGYWSIESWGGATFDACIRFLGEDPWVRLRELKRVMPNTPQQMLLRGQNLLGYRHYADDVVCRFVERAHTNGIDVFRIFDAMNDVRNLRTAVQATLAAGAHAQGTLCYTTSPVHTTSDWIDLACRLQDLGCHSLCIKDMAGLLRPYEAETLITELKQHVKLPLALHCHATTGLSLPTQMKAIDAGIDILDTAISTMSMTYGHSPTETIVAMLKESPRDTGMDLSNLEAIAKYFRRVRTKYARFEGSLRGIDSRILVAQVPGGMLTNLESQLKEQSAESRLDEVLDEIPRVRADLGYIPLVTPTSQIVGTQAVLNVLSGERYQTIARETAAILRGEYGATPSPVNPELQSKVLAGAAPTTCRPADLLAPEWEHLARELTTQAREQGIDSASLSDEDRLTYALFPQVGLKFLAHRNDPAFFETPPVQSDVTNTQKASQTPNAPPMSKPIPVRYDVRVNGRLFSVEVGPEGTLMASSLDNGISRMPEQVLSSLLTQNAVRKELTAPLSGSILRVLVSAGSHFKSGDVLLVMEAMKMEAEIRAPADGVVQSITLKPGEMVTVGQPLLWWHEI